MAHNVVVCEVNGEGQPQQQFLSRGVSGAARWVSEFPDAEKFTVRQAKTLAKKFAGVAIIDYGLKIEKRFNYGPVQGVRAQHQHKATEYVYEPGDCTRYVFVLTQADGHDFLASTIRGGRTMLLPTFWRDGMDVGYIRDKLGLNAYDGKVVQEFLRRVAEVP